MANLATFELPAALKDCARLIECAKGLLAHLDRSPTLDYQQPLGDLVRYMIGEMETVAREANRWRTLKLAAATRNLFELSFLVDFVCASDANMERFVLDAGSDELEIMRKFQVIDQRDLNHPPGQKVQDRMKALEAKIARAAPNERKPLSARQIAQAVHREAEFNELNQVYSKMSHATAWAILGGWSWDQMAKFRLLKSNDYAAECLQRVAKRAGFSGEAPKPTP
jgi:hypothetical protein